MKPSLWKSPLRLAGFGAVLFTGVAAAMFALFTGCAHPQPPAVIKPVVLPIGSFTNKWKAELPLEGDVVTDLFVRDEFVFVYTKSHTVYVLDRENGTRRATVNPIGPESRLFPPVVVKEYIAYPTILKIEVYDRKGHYVKEYDTGDLAIATGAVGYGSRLYLGASSTGTGRGVCVDLNGSQYKSVSEMWRLFTFGNITAIPAFHQGFVFFGDHKGNVYAVNSDSGAAIWPMRSEDTGREDKVFGAYGSIEADLKADDYGVYVASVDSELYCLDRNSGRVKWQFFAQVPLRHSPEVTLSTVYVYADDLGLVALDKQNSDPKQYDRMPRWVQPDYRELLGEDEKYAYVQRNDGAIVAADKTTGLTQFTSKRHYDFFAPNNRGGVAFVATTDGHIFATTLSMKPGLIGEMAQAPRSVPKSESKVALAQ